MKLPAALLVLLAVGVARLTAAEPSLFEKYFERWEDPVVAFQSADYAKRPKKGGILFTGSSTIARWKTLPGDFWRHPVVNRGIDGIEIAALTHFADRIIFAHEPRQIFLRCGGSDLRAGNSPEKVFRDFRDFVATIHARLPGTKIVWLSLHPCPALIAQWPQEKELNRLVADYCRDRPLLTYVDGEKLTVGADGQPDLTLFAADKQHLNSAGYKRLADLVRPHLSK